MERLMHSKVAPGKEAMNSVSVLHKVAWVDQEAVDTCAAAVVYLKTRCWAADSLWNLH